MPYSGLLALIILAFIGIILARWSQRRDEAQAAAIEEGEEKRAAPAAEATVAADASVPAGLDPALIAVIAAAVATAGDTSPSPLPFRRREAATSLWVQSGRQELVGAMPANLRGRFCR